MNKLKRTHSEAYLQKMRSVFYFNEFYAKNPCSIGEGILQTYDKSKKDFALVRIFIDLSLKESQPYVIFINKLEGFVSLDLVSTPKTSEEIAKNHLVISPDHLIFGIGSLIVKDATVFLQPENQPDVLAAALLWAADFECNLNPESGLDSINEFLSPDC